MRRHGILKQRKRHTKNVKRAGNCQCGTSVKIIPSQTAEGTVIKFLELTIKRSTQQKAALAY